MRRTSSLHLPLSQASVKFPVSTHEALKSAILERHDRAEDGHDLETELICVLGEIGGIWHQSMAYANQEGHLAHL